MGPTSLTTSLEETRAAFVARTKIRSYGLSILASGGKCVRSVTILAIRIGCKSQSTLLQSPRTAVQRHATLRDLARREH
jgi:hypothetical protein